MIVFSLYRAHLREIRKLPHLYLQYVGNIAGERSSTFTPRQFYRLKTRNDTRTMLAPSGAAHLPSRIKRATRGLRRLQAANLGHHKAFERMLDLAYGRRGKLKWELLDPLLKDPDAPLPPTIIPQIEKSRPPVYSKPLVALLTSPQSMATRHLRQNAWTPEKLLPARANPTSEEAYILGPFSKRRELNKRWRFYNQERAKVIPPLEISSWTTQRPPVAATLPLQGLGVFSDIEDLVGAASPIPLTRKERKAGITQAETSYRHPSRWVRRRYRSLLAKLPILAYHTKDANDQGSYSIRLSDRAMETRPMSNIDETNLAWLMQGMTESIGSAKRRGKKT